MTLDEIDKQLESDEERLVSSLQNLKNAKVEYRKARITAISNKLLAPYRRFKVAIAIARYDAMMERLEKKRAKAIAKAEKLQEKERKRIRKQAKEDFKAALRDKRREDIKNSLLDIKNMGVSAVSSASSFITNVKNSVIDKIQENTVIDLVIKNAIEDLKLKYAVNRYDNVVKLRERQIENEKIEQKKESSHETLKKENDINVQKVSKKGSYIGRASNRAILYAKINYISMNRKINNKIHDLQNNVKSNVNIVAGKVSSAKSKLVTTFNYSIAVVKDKVSSNVASIKRNIDIKKAERLQEKENQRIRNERKKDIIAALREDEERKNAVKKAQLENYREATKAVSEDLFANSASIENTMVNSL